VDAVLCIECGYNLKTGAQLETVYERFERRWNTGGMPWVVRLIAFGIVELLGLVLFLAVDSLESFLSISFLYGIGSVFWLFAWGYLAQIAITKNERGEPVLRQTTWLCFIPIGTKTVRLRRYEDIRLSHEPGGLNFLILVALFCFCMPGAVLYLLMFLLGRGGATFTLKISEGHGLEPEIVYCGISEAKMKDIAETLHSVAELRYA
jgi:hypothetical protein